MREFKIDVMDAMQVERYEQALMNVKNAKGCQSEKASDQIKHQCEIVRMFFDDCFGVGAGQERFGDSWNYRDHFNAMSEVVDQTGVSIDESRKEMAENVVKYSANRATRRTK